VPQIEFNRYYRYQDLTALLEAYVAENPTLIQLESIGKSHEGRDIWLVTVTNQETGPASDKPAFWCDGNIHASEVSASTAVLRLLQTLVEGHTNATTPILDSRAFYLVPRLNPDGAEWALETPPRIIRSSTRPYPYDEEDPYGLERQDLDGDGRILNMRIKDPNGPWKVSEAEPRLMVRRDAGESGGTYYRTMPEGVFHNFDGMTMRGRKIKEGLDMNRNFPAGWRQEFEQHGAGPFPTSEPEINSAVSAITARPNICGAVTFHTYSGVHLRPPSGRPDDELPAEDIWTFKKLGEKGTEMTGYPAIAVYHDFRYHPKEVITGVFDDWMYEHRGVYSWTTEIWSPQRQAGITDYKYIDWFREHPFSDDLKMLKWSDEKLGGKGYVEWYEFEHPQLGKIELGGWDGLYAFRNPPPDFLEAEVKPLGDWAIWQASCSPKLELREVRTEPVGDSHVRIRFAVQNTGWLPTNVTKIAVDRKLCRGVVGEILRGGQDFEGKGDREPHWLKAGLLRQQAGQLVGWSHVTAGGFGWGMDSTDDVAVFQWVVEKGAAYELVAKHERAGVVRETITV
jgi:murein tripeptide amidase MpaA